MESNFKTWEKIRKEYETTKTSYIKLSKKYGFHEKTVQARSKKGEWVKFKKGLEEAIKKGKYNFMESVALGIEDLKRIEDNSLSNLQDVVDGKLENLKGDLIVKIDGTVKGITEAAMMIGDKRRELRGLLSLKDQEMLLMKKKEFKHKKALDQEKLELDKIKMNIEMEKFGILKSQVMNVKDGSHVKKINVEELLFHVGKGFRKFLHSRKLRRSLKGARGSKKTKTVFLEGIQKILDNKEANILCIRAVFKDHRTSTFMDFKWAARKFGVYDQFKFTTSPLEITVKATGQKIYFRGMNDPLSITGISVDVGSLCWVIVEEAFQLRSKTDWEKIEMSIRGRMAEGLYPQFTFLFNAWSSRHWLNKFLYKNKSDDLEILQNIGEQVVHEDEETLAITVAYGINEFLSAIDHRRYDIIKNENYARWLIEAMGFWGIAEGLILTENKNYIVEDFDCISLEKGNHDEVKVGGDWGYNDPTAFIKTFISESERKIYIWGEYYEREKIIEDLKDELLEYKDFGIIADSSDPSKIRSMYEHDYDIDGAVKGPGSIVAGIDFLKGFKLIVHTDCVNLIIELNTYCWDTKNGIKLDKPIDSNNHIIDAIRYAVEEETLKLKGNSAFY